MKRLVLFSLLVLVGCQACGCDLAQPEEHVVLKTNEPASQPAREPAELGDFSPLPFGQEAIVPEEKPDLRGPRPDPLVREPKSVLAGVIQRPQVHVYTTANCPACTRLYRDVAREDSLAGYTWRFFGRQSAPGDLTRFPTLYFKGRDGWYKLEGWRGARWFNDAFTRVQKGIGD